MTVFKTLVAVFLAALSMIIMSPGNVAASNTAEEILLAEQRAISRINLAARQRYLVQNISKSLCFAMSKFNPAENAAQAWISLDTFNESFRALVDGDPARDMAPEKDPSVQAALDVGATAWKTYEAATRQIVSGDWHTVPVAQILNLNTIVLAQTNASVDTIVEVHTKDLMTQKAYAATVNVAGRQRMLTQKAAKEMCFIALDIKADKMRASLAGTLELFETSLHALENGDYDMSVIDPPNLAVLIKISEIRTAWDAFRERVDATLSGAAPTEDDMIYVEAANRTLFELSNELVALYFK